MALVADSWNDLDAMLTTLSTHCSAFGLSISYSKTKTMAVLPASLSAQPVPIHLFPNHPPVEPVSSFQYLGRVIQEDCNSDLKVSSRICKASKSFSSLIRTLRSRQSFIFSVLSLSSTLLYDTECAVLLQPHIHRWQSFIMRCLHIILLGYEA